MQEHESTMSSYTRTNTRARLCAHTRTHIHLVSKGRVEERHARVREHNVDLDGAALKNVEERGERIASDADLAHLQDVEKKSVRILSIYNTQLHSTSYLALGAEAIEGRQRLRDDDV